MTENRTLPVWAQYASGGVLLAVALTAGAVSLTLNVSHGLTAGLASGIAFGLADIGKLTIPIVAGLIGWSRQMKITAAVCVAVSLWCAVNYWADRHGQNLASREHAATVYSDKASQIESLKTEIASYDALTAQEAADGGCGAKCQNLLNAATGARKRLSDAYAARSEAKPVEINGLAVMMAVATGGEPSRIARWNGAVTAVLFLALLEALVWLSVPAMTTLRKAKATDEEKPIAQIADESASAEVQAVSQVGHMSHGEPAPNQPRDARGRFAKKWTRPEDYSANPKVDALEPA